MAAFGNCCSHSSCSSSQIVHTQSGSASMRHALQMACRSQSEFDMKFPSVKNLLLQHLKLFPCTTITLKTLLPKLVIFGKESFQVLVITNF